MNVSQEIVQTIKEIRSVLQNDIENMLQKKENNPFSVYEGILLQIQQILVAIGRPVAELDEKLSGLGQLYENRADRQGIYDCYNGMMDLFDDMYVNALLAGKSFGVIQRNDPVPGIGSHIITNLGQIEAVLQAGQIPVIDTINVENCLKDISSAKNTNAWELYFEQPLGFGLEEIPPDAEVTVWDGIPNNMPYYDMDFLTNPFLQRKWRRRAKRFMKPTPELHQHIERTISETPFRDADTILGVLCRGTDYTSIRPYNHPVQPETAEVLRKVNCVMKQNDLEMIYLATEDAKIKKMFKAEFGDRVFDSQNIYYEKTQDELLTQINRERQIDTHQKNLEYLTALALLGKCPYFMGGRTSGTVVSLIFGEEHAFFDTWNYGRYGVDDIWKVW